jgi:hypothetical protein
LGKVDGARLIVTRWSGHDVPELTTAARTRSRASLTIVSARPTTTVAGMPLLMSTSTSTGRPASPSSVTA